MTKKPKLSKARREQLRRRQDALNSTHYTLEELVRKLEALGDFDANAPHVRCIAAALALLYRDRLKV